MDRRAKALRLSRNRLIVRALEREVSEPSGWSPEFFDRLRDVDAGTAKAVARRTSQARSSTTSYTVSTKVSDIR